MKTQSNGKVKVNKVERVFSSFFKFLIWLCRFLDVLNFILRLPVWVLSGMSKKAKMSHGLLIQ